MSEERKYDRALYLQPFYKGKVSFYETCMFLEKGEIKSLLYPIRKILSVHDYGLKKEYVEGQDFVVTEDGKLRLTENTSIPVFGVDEYFMKEPRSMYQMNYLNNHPAYRFSEHRWTKYAEGDTFTKCQIAVTYEHEEGWEGTKPVCQADKLKRFIGMLKEGKTPNVVFFGDSITVGCNSSGSEFAGYIAPHAETWPVMVYRELEEIFHTRINYYNSAVGGMNTEWGAANADKRVNAYHPDLVVLAFGMNDGSSPVAHHLELIRKILRTVKGKNPEAEFILVKTTVPNPLTDWYSGGNQKSFGSTYDTLNLRNVAVTDMTHAQLDILRRKDYYDMTGNNINHPNDYLARIYAQMVLGTIVERRPH